MQEVSLQERMEQRAKAKRMNTPEVPDEAKVTFEVRSIERFEVVRVESSEHCGSVSTCGEFRSRDDAERVAEVMRKSAH